MTETEKAAIYGDYRKKVYGYVLNHICSTSDAEKIMTVAKSVLFGNSGENADP